MAISRKALAHFFDALLNPDAFKDYSPNGLQIEGTCEIKKIAFAVSATQKSIQQAVDNHANALVVHHGLFWKFHGARSITGAFANRVIPLVRNQINLFGYHLPLDAHPDVGNAATLGRLINCYEQQPFGDYQGSATGIKGTLGEPVSAKELRSKLQNILAHDVILASPDEGSLIQSIGIITGGANSEWKTAVDAGLDAYLTGEISEHDWHESQENGLHMFAGGHNATEQFGIQSLMASTQKQFSVDCFFIPSQNPA
jgi:dinuclear metal center YbgI/SA1388 family protein